MAKHPDKSFFVIVAFALLAITVSRFPNPWGDGPLLDIWPELPTSLQPEPEDDENTEETELATVDLGSALEEIEVEPAPELVVEEVPGEVGPPPPSARELDLATTIRADEALLGIMRDLTEELGRPRQTLEVPCVEGEAGSCERGALDHFFSRLRDTALRQTDTPVRYSQFGDSLIQGDQFCDFLRRPLQEQFGDGGHGWVYINNPERLVGNRSLNVSYSGEWEINTIIHGGGNGLYGFAGAAFTDGTDPVVNIRPTDEGPGSRFDRVGVQFFSRGGRVDFITRDGDERRVVSFETEPGTSQLQWFERTNPAERFQVANFVGRAIWFGLIVENAGPGVVVDNVGLVSSRISKLHNFDEEHWQSQIALRDPDVLAFFYGVNSASERFARYAAGYQEQYEESLRRAMAAPGERDCIVLGILTRGHYVGGSVETMETVPLVRDRQRAAALAHGCAFFDSYASIGGEDGAPSWYNAGWLGSDMIHLTNAGYRELSSRFYVALMHAFRDYLDRRIAQQESELAALESARLNPGSEPSVDQPPTDPGTGAADEATRGSGGGTETGEPDLASEGSGAL